MTTTPRTVLLTGAAGGVARCVGKALRDAGMHVRGLDRLDVPQVVGFVCDELLVGDIADERVLHEAVAGVDAIVHLAANPNGSSALIEDLIEPNIIGLHHLFEAATAHDVRRIVLASSCQTMTGYDGPRPAPIDAAAPVNHYGLTKLWAEAVGEMHARKTGASVLAVRIGWFACTVEVAEQIQR
ncbi:MAG: NAD(P)-dependent oxidoreductase, partial [Planctomycetota bacterium]